eukprot:9743549-Alexandrium_andersonii.AAC.1
MGGVAVHMSGFPQPISAPLEQLHARLCASSVRAWAGSRVIAVPLRWRRPQAAPAPARRRARAPRALVRALRG